MELFHPCGEEGNFFFCAVCFIFFVRHGVLGFGVFVCFVLYEPVEHVEFAVKIRV